MVAKDLPASGGGARGTGLLLDQEDSLEKEMATYSSIFTLENSMDRGVWRGYSPWGHREPDMTEHAHAACGKADG